MNSAAFERFSDPSRSGVGWRDPLSPLREQPRSGWRALTGSTGERADVKEIPVARALSRDELERAVTDAIPAALRLATRLSGDEGIAEEAVQEALLRVAKSWRRFRGEAAVATWLTRIVIHCVRDTLRRRPVEPLLECHQPQSPPAEGPAQQAITAEFQQAVVRAVAQLPARQREVFALIVWEGLPAREVADLLSIQPQNVHSNLHAARARLKELLARHLDQTGSQAVAQPLQEDGGNL